MKIQTIAFIYRNTTAIAIAVMAGALLIGLSAETLLKIGGL